MSDNTFKFILPVDLSKSEDGDWKIKGLASTEDIDIQGERVLQKGIDLTPIARKQGVINYDHEKGPENTIGILDGYQMTNQGLYLEGRLFKDHDKAKAVKQIMTSLKDSDRGRMGMSVEGAILKRNEQNPKIIEKCVINAVALTMKPVNSNTYVDLIKSLSSDSLEFQAEGLELEKALGVGDGGTQAPDTRTGGDALQTSNFSSDDEDEKELVLQRPLKKQSKEKFKKSLITVLDDLQKLHPEISRNILWEMLQTRMEATFPELRN